MSDRDVVLKVGDTFAGSYRIVGELGSGNNGVVYLARHELLGREVALKVLRPELADDRELIAALMKEARIAANLNHPNIVQALDAGECDGVYYLAMEYVKGRTLEDIRINSPETISLEFLTEIAIELAAALDYAWNEFSIVHGDIKPDNLIVSDDTHTLRLADLGLANISGRGNSSDGSFMATPMYVAPELVAGKSAATMHSDIYSFGIMLYELVAGKPPFNGDTEEILRAHLEEEPPPLLGENPDVPRALAEFIHKMMKECLNILNRLDM
jgi:serine/threonine-protein kinase